MEIMVFRVEHAVCGIGPYRALEVIPELQQFCDEITKQHSNSYSHPTPQADGIRNVLDVWRDYYCGFLYLEDLERWFDGWMESLLKEGFVVAKYLTDYDDIVVGNSGQIIFKKKDEKRVA